MMSQRWAEKKYLEQFYNTEGNQVVVVYGGHGIGKTALVRDFCTDKPYGYHLAASGSERQQRYDWARELEEEGLELPDYPTYTQIWETQTRIITHKKVMIIDEFQNLVKNSDTFMDELIFFVKKEQSQQSLLVILCSSTVGWVENAMVPRIGHAALDLSGLLKLKPLPFRLLREQYPSYDIKDCVALYGITGGIPAYWKEFDPKRNLRENICNAILSPSGALFYEAPRLVGEELRELAVYNTILSALAEGRHKLNELYLHTGFSRAKISVYLRNLMELEIAEKIFSYDTDGRANTQKGIYRIRNPFVRFYYTFLYPHLGKLDTMDPGEFYDRYVGKYLSAYGDSCFRDVCLEYMEMQHPLSKRGIWQGKTGCIDIVAVDGEGHTIVALCSFSRLVTSAEYEQFLLCLKKAKLEPEEILIFGGEGFAPQVQAEERLNRLVHLISAQQLTF